MSDRAQIEHFLCVACVLGDRDSTLGLQQFHTYIFFWKHVPFGWILHVVGTRRDALSYLELWGLRRDVILCYNGGCVWDARFMGVGVLKSVAKEGEMQRWRRSVGVWPVIAIAAMAGFCLIVTVVGLGHYILSLG